MPDHSIDNSQPIDRSKGYYLREEVHIMRSFPNVHGDYLEIIARNADTVLIVGYDSLNNQRDIALRSENETVLVPSLIPNGIPFVRSLEESCDTLLTRKVDAKKRNYFQINQFQKETGDTFNCTILRDGPFVNLDVKYNLDLDIGEGVGSYEVRVNWKGRDGFATVNFVYNEESVSVFEVSHFREVAHMFDERRQVDERMKEIAQVQLAYSIIKSFQLALKTADFFDKNGQYS